MYRWDFLRHHNIQGPKILQGVNSRYEDAFQTHGDIPIHVLYIVSPTGSEGFVKGETLRLLRTNSSIKALEENITKLKKPLLKRGYPQNFIQWQRTLRSEVSTKDISSPPTKQNKKNESSLHNTMPPSSSKSSRNLNEEVVPTTIAKSNFQGTAHNIIQKRAHT